jgi:hypothetical protein
VCPAADQQGGFEDVRCSPPISRSAMLYLLSSMLNSCIV